MLGVVAGILPKVVLHHIMPVFTFMGVSTIRHDDNYTFTVMQKVNASLICFSCLSKSILLKHKRQRVTVAKGDPASNGEARGSRGGTFAARVCRQL